MTTPRHLSDFQWNSELNSRSREMWPKVSVVLPVYNEIDNIIRCLLSIGRLEYPENKLEILIADGGSSDGTLAKIKDLENTIKYSIKIYDNSEKDAESGKSICIQNSTGRFILLIDADNEILGNKWLMKMLTPLLTEENIFGVESYYLHAPSESFINRYFTEIGISDPFARYLKPRLDSQECDKYQKFTIKNSVPPIGANGFIWRKEVIHSVGGYEPKFEEANFTAMAVKSGYNTFAKVDDTGICHYYVESIYDHIQKSKKIGSKFISRKNNNKDTWVDTISRSRFILSTIYSASFILPLIESVYMLHRRREPAWILHPFLLTITIYIYITVYLINLMPDNRILKNG